MRERIGILLALAVCLVLTACTPGGPGQETQGGNEDTQGFFDGNAPMPGYDADNRYMLWEGISFQETENYFFGTVLGGEYIHYYDMQTGISGLLCPDPACTHDSGACPARVGIGASVSYYNGKLYWVGKDPAGGGNDEYLWRSDITGATREKLKTISFQDTILVYQPQQYYIHRGNLYFLGKANTVDGVETGKRVTLMMAPLEGGGGFTPLFDETFLGGADATIRFVGNRLYFAVQSFLADGSVNLTITCYDRTDGTSQVLFEQADITYIAGDMWVTEAGEIYMPVLVENVGQVLKLEDGAWTEVMSLEGENVAAPTILDGIVEFDGVTEGTRWVHIFTSSGETAYEGALFPEAIPGIEEDPNTLSLAIVGGDREKLILCLESWTGSGSIEYIVMLDLTDNLKPTVLWSDEF
ncbi:MAG TPA: hypothetical protein IAB79_05025 [Candidatus Faecousia excrementipullorum]|nr:hypothetical protein [Candidatus Faecousia excrementipullorum]